MFHRQLITSPRALTRKILLKNSEVHPDLRYWKETHTNKGFNLAEQQNENEIEPLRFRTPKYYSKYILINCQLEHNFPMNENSI